MDSQFFHDLWYHIAGSDVATTTEDENIFFDAYADYRNSNQWFAKYPGILDVIIRLVIKYRFHFDD